MRPICVFSSAARPVCRPCHLDVFNAAQNLYGQLNVRHARDEKSHPGDISREQFVVIKSLLKSARKTSASNTWIYLKHLRSTVLTLGWMPLDKASRSLVQVAYSAFVLHHKNTDATEPKGCDASKTASCIKRHVVAVRQALPHVTVVTSAAKFQVCM